MRLLAYISLIPHGHPAVQATMACAKSTLCVHHGLWPGVTLQGALWLQVFDLMAWVFLKLRIDDPLGAAPMHGFGGAWGLFFCGLLAKEEYIMQTYSGTYPVTDRFPNGWTRNVFAYGAFYPHSNGPL